MKSALLALLLAGCAMSAEQQAQFNRGVDTITRARQQQPYGSPQGSRPSAMFQGDQMSGFNRICYYNRLGSAEAITIPATQLCPLSLP